MLEAFCTVVDAMAISHKDLDCLILARDRIGQGRMQLPELVELFLSRPLATVPLGAQLLNVTPKAVDLMLTQLGGARLRELTS